MKTHTLHLIFIFVFLIPVFAASQQQQKILATDGSEGDEFGGAVAIYNETALVGAAKNDDLGNSSGSAYVIENLPVGIETCTEPEVKLYIGYV